MTVKVSTRPSTWQRLLRREGVGSIGFALEGADSATVRALGIIAPVDREELREFNPGVGALQFSAKANKKMLHFLLGAREHLPEGDISDDYQGVVDTLQQKYPNSR